MADNQDRVGSWARVILLAFLIVLALSLLLPGIIVYQDVVNDWMNDPRGFYGIEGAVNWIFGVFAAGAIAGSLILVGVIIRILRWRRAPLASLSLAVLSAGFIIATYLIFSDTNATPDSFEIIFLQGCSILLLLLVALPPFLHWAMKKPESLPIPTEPRP